MHIFTSIMLFTFEILFGLSSNMRSVIYSLFQNNGSENFQFTSNFESMHLAESYKAFSLVKCLSLSLKNSSIKAITYEVSNDSTIYCKFYSPLVIKYSDLTIKSTSVKLYLSNDITIMPPGNRIFYFAT